MDVQLSIKVIILILIFIQIKIPCIAGHISIDSVFWGLSPLYDQEAIIEATIANIPTNADAVSRYFLLIMVLFETIFM